jgi:UDP-N-acetylglucosamine:LPS N-acetylglucosamine transferase
MKIMAVLGKGGHTKETLNLVDCIDRNDNYTYLVDVFDKMASDKLRKKGKLLRVLSPRDAENTGFLATLLKIVFTFLLSIYYIARYRPKVIIGVGGSTCVPAFYAAKILRVNTFYVESVARVKYLSLTGKMVYPVTDCFMVQWEELAKYYKVIYGGLLL